MSREGNNPAGVGVARAAVALGRALLAGDAGLRRRVVEGRLSPEAFAGQLVALMLRVVLAAIMESEGLLHAKGVGVAARRRHAAMGPLAGRAWAGVVKTLRGLERGDAALGLRATGLGIWGRRACPDLMRARAEGWAEAGREIASWLAAGVDAYELGAGYERLLSLRVVVAASGVSIEAEGSGARRRGGVFYTPSRLVEHALEVAGVAGAESVCDPACGSGNFLVAAAARMCRGKGAAAREAAARRVYGVDHDPVAADLCRFSLWRFVGRPGGPWSWLARQVVVADALSDPAPMPWGVAAGAGFRWRRAFPRVARAGGFEVVVGNPPFLNQLRTTTAVSRERAGVLKAWSGGAVGGYTDAAAAFLLRAMMLARPGGRVAMVQPQSTLSARDGSLVRRAVLDRGVLESIWISDRSVFPGASVVACIVSASVVGLRAGPTMRVRRFEASSLEPAGEIRVGRAELREAATWSVLAARARGVPGVAPDARWGRLDELATATADFRDEYYGLQGFLVEDTEVPGADEAGYPRLITSGLLDAARSWWGERGTRVLKRAWRAPRVDRGRVEAAGALGAWAARRLVPKVLVATQTRALEAVVDERGAWLPLTPVITVVPRESGDLWRVAAVLLSPVASAVAMERTAGSALSAGAIKLSAREVLALPTPADAGAWQAAAELVRGAHAADDASRPGILRAAGGLMTRAYGLDAAAARVVDEWWASRAFGGRGA